MSPLHVVILAAGQGSRMKSALPKVLHPIAGRPMLHHVIATARQLGAEKIHTVIGHGADRVRETTDEASVNWVIQSEQLGTGHAVAQALPNRPHQLLVRTDVRPADDERTLQPALFEALAQVGDTVPPVDEVNPAVAVVERVRNRYHANPRAPGTHITVGAPDSGISALGT